MRNTTYYNLNIVEGSDIVNPLTVDNPNYESIDEAMHDNAVSGVTLATEIANATVHAITRENSECAVIRFIATSEWKSGDSVTVDGVPVTALLPSGETLPDGAYVINSNVLCILTGTNMTVFAERKKIDTAKEIKYNDTNVGAELDNINRNLISLNKFKFNRELTTDIIPFQLDKRYDVYIINLITDKNDIFKTVTVMHEIGESDINMLVEISSPWVTSPAKLLINFDAIQYFSINVSIRELGSFTRVTLSSIIGIKLPLN